MTVPALRLFYWIGFSFGLFWGVLVGVYLMWAFGS